MTRPIAFQRPDQRVVELLPWSEDDLAIMAQVTEADIQHARLVWRDMLPRRWRLLLEARRA